MTNFENRFEEKIEKMMDSSFVELNENGIANYLECEEKKLKANLMK